MHDYWKSWDPQGRAIGDSFSIAHKSKTRVARQLRAEAVPCTDHLTLKSKDPVHQHAQKILLGGQRRIKAKDVLPRHLCGRIHLD